jgi:hypothetical protein
VATPAPAEAARAVPVNGQRAAAGVPPREAVALPGQKR